MGNSLQRLLAKHPRTQKLQANIVGGLFIKGGNLLISLLLIRLLVQYLDKETYGVWVTVSSLATFTTFLDLGLGNGLRNKLAEANSKQQFELGRAYVSTSYLVFSLIQTIFLAVLAVLTYSLDWQRIFNTKISNDLLQTIILISFAGFCIKLVIDIINYVLLAVQQSAVAGSIQLVTGGFTLLAIWIFRITNRISIETVTALSILIPIVISTIYSALIFTGNLKIYRPSWKSVNFSHLKPLLSLGSHFFIIQLAVVVIFYTDNLIITYLFGPEAVADYNIAYRYFNVINTLFFIVITPFWSAVTEAQAKGDMNWVKASYKNLQFCWFGVLLAVLLLIGIAEPVYKLWLGNNVKISALLNVMMGIFVLISCWNNIVAAILNGFSKIRLQLYASIIAAMINIPLCIYFGRFLEMGSSGVILATIFSLLICTLVCTLQVHKLLNMTAAGLWNK